MVWYNKKSSFSTADSIAVTAGQDAGSVNATLSWSVSIIVNQPAGGATLTTGTTKTIQWATSGIHNAYVKIQLYKDTTKVLDIDLNTDNDGSKACGVNRH